MSFVIANPEMLAAAATDLAGIRSVIVLTVAQAVGVMGRRSTRAGFK